MGGLEPLPAPILCSKSRSEFLFHWAEVNITYLGTKISLSIDRMFKANLPPLQQSIKEELRQWHRHTYTWFGRKAILKMTIMPRVLYLFQTLLITIPQSFLKTLWWEILKLCMGTSHPPLSHNYLTILRLNGGIAIPGPMKYHQASYLYRVIAWHRDYSCKQWVSLEQASSDNPLLFRLDLPFHRPYAPEPHES